MIEIKDLLGKFSDLLLSEEEKKRAVGNIVSEIIKTKIDSRDIKIKNGTVYLNLKSIYKNEIFLKKDQISFKLKEALGKKAPKDIR